MATNKIAEGNIQTWTVAGKSSGDPVILGKMTGVCLTDTDSVSGNVEVDLNGVYDLSVKAIDDAGNSAVADGDMIFYVVGDTPVLSKKSTGVFFGYAREAVSTGATATIEVDQVKGPGPGAADVPDGSIATAKIADGAVTLAKMDDMATASVIYRKTAATGVPEVNTLATLKTDLDLTGTNSGDQTITLTGDVTGTGTGSFATTIAEGAVEDSMIEGLSAGQIILGVDGTAANNLKAVLSGDVTMDATGAVTIAAKAVEDTMISAGAGTVLVGTKTDLDVTLLDNSAAGSLVIGQGAGETCAAAALSGDVTMSTAGVVTIAEGAVEDSMIEGLSAGQIILGVDGTAANNLKSVLSGDVTMDATGAVTIAAGAVESSMLANGAGVASLLTAGLGGSVSVTKASATTDTVIAAHGTKDRACLVLVVVDETYAIGTGTLPTVAIGEDDTIGKAMADSVLDDEVAGTVLAFAFTNTATKKIIVTSTAAVGDSTGGCSVTVLAIPTT